MKRKLSSTSKPGRPQITTKREVRAMKHYVNNNSFETAAGISQKKRLFNKDVSRYTVSCRLYDFGLKAYSPITKRLISKKNRVARLICAEAHVFWQKLIGKRFTLAMKVSLI